jgi:flagellum-specific peptidoglycan hydrolase FlgJ
MISQSYEEVKDYIYKQDSLQHKEIVLRQAVLETGWFKSYNCKNRHNLFGFRWKPWVSENNKMGYIIFDTWEESVDYYVRWQGRHYEGGDYYTFLKDVGYATSPTYVEKLKGIKLK